MGSRVLRRVAALRASFPSTLATLAPCRYVCYVRSPVQQHQRQQLCARLRGLSRTTVRSGVTAEDATLVAVLGASGDRHPTQGPSLPDSCSRTACDETQLLFRRSGGTPAPAVLLEVLCQYTSLQSPKSAGNSMLSASRDGPHECKKELSTAWTATAEALFGMYAQQEDKQRTLTSAAADALGRGRNLHQLHAYRAKCHTSAEEGFFFLRMSQTVSRPNFHTLPSGTVQWLLQQAVRHDATPLSAARSLTETLYYQFEASLLADRDGGEGEDSRPMTNELRDRNVTAFNVFGSAINDVMRDATPAHLAEILHGLTEPTGRVAQGSLPRRWRSMVTPRVAVRCLQRVADVVCERRGRAAVLPDSVLQSLYDCALCELPASCSHVPLRAATHLLNSPSGASYLPASTTIEASAMALVAMICLKNAPCCTLCRLYEYFESVESECVMEQSRHQKGAKWQPSHAGAHLTRPTVLVLTRDVHKKFLAYCGANVLRVTQRGLSLDGAERGAIMRAISALTQAVAQRDGGGGATVADVEEGLVHGCAALNVLGGDGASRVRAVYASCSPGLRETAHSVMACALLCDAKGAVAALSSLGLSRPEGWITVPTSIAQVMTATCRLVGARGRPEDVQAAYVAVVGFHNAGMNVSQVMEFILAGICDRIDAVEEHFDFVLGAVPPRKVLEHIIPVARAALSCIGDDINADMMLELLESALRAPQCIAVPLTAAVVWSLSHAAECSLAVSDLFSRVDASTHNLPFLQYYALCYARDTGRVPILEHLAAVWHADPRPIVLRASHLAPPCKLWRCVSCGRLNTDRFNYCSCSSLRNGFVICGRCGYGQDERVPLCQSCGLSLVHHRQRDTDVLTGVVANGGCSDIATAVLRKGWRCRECHASNPARQMILCFRCSKPTGPLCLAHEGVEGRGNGERTREEVSRAGASAIAHSGGHSAPVSCAAFCKCAGDKVARSGGEMAQVYSALVGYCHRCGQFASEYAAQHSSLWRCVGCSQLRSSLERACPSCPQVDWLPLARVQGSSVVGTVRVCAKCGEEETNVFATSCAACGSLKLVSKASSARAGEGKCVGDDGGVQKRAQSEEEEPVTNETAFCLCPQCGTLEPYKTSGEYASPAVCGVCGTSSTSSFPNLFSSVDTASAPLDDPSSGLEEVDATRSMQPSQPLLPLLLQSRECQHCHSLLPHTCLSSVCPRCGAYVPVSVDVVGSTASCAQTLTISVLKMSHTCSTLVALCEGTREQEDSADSTQEKDLVLKGDERDGERYVTLAASIETLTTEWLDDTVNKSETAPSTEALLAIRVEMSTALARVVRSLSAHYGTCAPARHAAALVKQLLEALDKRCGIGGSLRFSVNERCHDCLGTHPAEVCEYASDEHRQWLCEVCGAANTNKDVGRYVCVACLSLRPVVQECFPTECWECPTCLRANVEFERYCIHCGHERVRQRLGAEEEGEGGEEESALQGKETMDAGEIGNTSSSSMAARMIPFLPAKCALCGLIFLEGRCPLCENHIPDVVDCTGTVSFVASRHAFIQPAGTKRPQDCVYVGERILRKVPLSEGKMVHYCAEVVNNGSLRATYVR